MTETTPIFDTLNDKYTRRNAISQTANLFDDAAEEVWRSDKAFEMFNVPTEEEWTSLLEFLSSALLYMASDPEHAEVFFPESDPTVDAVRQGELRAVGYTIAARTLSMLTYPDWEDVDD